MVGADATEKALMPWQPNGMFLFYDGYIHWLIVAFFFFRPLVLGEGY